MQAYKANFDIDVIFYSSNRQTISIISASDFSAERRRRNQTFKE